MRFMLIDCTSDNASGCTRYIDLTILGHVTIQQHGIALHKMTDHTRMYGINSKLMIYNYLHSHSVNLNTSPLLQAHLVRSFKHELF